jgi:hypothetical protein
MKWLGLLLAVIVLGISGRAAQSVEPSTRPAAATTATTATGSPQRGLALAPTGGAVSCYIGRPCVVPQTAWTYQRGCTKQWRVATGKPCPPGWPPLP